MIIDGKDYVNTYKCVKMIADYLIYEKNLPVFDVDKNFYYFRESELLDEILGSMPIWLKLIDKLTNS
jgi:hypothetical protein